MQLKAQTRTHPSGSQSGRSAAIPLRTRSQTTLPRHPLHRSAQHLRALGPARYRSQACARGSSRSHACAQARHRSSPPRAPAPRPPHAARWARLLPLPRLRARLLPRPGLRAAPVLRAGSPAPARWALPRSRALGAAPLPRSGLARASGCARGRCRGRSRVRLQWRME